MASTAIHIAEARFRVRLWQGRTDVAYVAPLTTAATLGADVMSELRQRLRREGYRSVVTSAMAPRECDCFIADDFELHSHLEALICYLSAPLPRLPDPRWRTRKLRRADLAQVIQVDADAFEPFWRLDAAGIREARSVTPYSRWRAPLAPASTPRVSAYCITGRAGGRGYLQRLAVSPRWQGHGLGVLLVADSLRWLKRAGAQVVVVNTHPDNERALSLYERCGFQPRPNRLAVLCRDLL